MSETGNGGDFIERRFSAPDGLMLSARIYGEHNNRDCRLPVVCLPGLSRNARDFHGLALHLSRGAEPARKVVVFDYRGRGRSDHDRDWRNYDIPTETADVLAGLTALGIERAAFVATSRGGLIVFALAGARPAALGPVVLNDVGPELGGAALAQIRAFMERAPRPRDWAEAIAIVRTANAHAFPALTEADWERWARAVYREDKGRLVADFDPRLLKTLKGIDFGKPLPTFWAQFAGLRALPLLAIRGENSALLSAETLATMARRHETMKSHIVEGQGHAPMLDTAGLPELIGGFIARNDRG